MWPTNSPCATTYRDLNSVPSSGGGVGNGERGWEAAAGGGHPRSLSDGSSSGGGGDEASHMPTSVPGLPKHHYVPSPAMLDRTMSYDSAAAAAAADVPTDADVHVSGDRAAGSAGAGAANGVAAAATAAGVAGVGAADGEAMGAEVDGSIVGAAAPGAAAPGVAAPGAAALGAGPARAGGQWQYDGDSPVMPPHPRNTSFSDPQDQGPVPATAVEGTTEVGIAAEDLDSYKYGGTGASALSPPRSPIGAQALASGGRHLSSEKPAAVRPHMYCPPRHRHAFLTLVS